ncbi:MAG: hypothetical protein ACYTF3_14050 [Planctomycetota bacterium]
MTTRLLLGIGCLLFVLACDEEELCVRDCMRDECEQYSGERRQVCLASVSNSCGGATARCRASYCGPDAPAPGQ